MCSRQTYLVDFYEVQKYSLVSVSRNHEVEVSELYNRRVIYCIQSKVPAHHEDICGEWYRSAPSWLQHSIQWWSISCPDCFKWVHRALSPCRGPGRNSPDYSFNRRLGQSQSSGCLSEEKNLFLWLRTESKFISHVAHSPVTSRSRCCTMSQHLLKTYRIYAKVHLESQ